MTALNANASAFSSASQANLATKTPETASTVNVAMQATKPKVMQLFSFKHDQPNQVLMSGHV